MAEKANVLLICGGGSTEHDISLISAKYLLAQLQNIPDINVHYLCIERDGRRTNLEGEDCELRKSGEIFNKSTEEIIRLNYAIPCIHGPPGENGQIQSVFELMGLPFLGAGSEASITCFNKVSTKLWLESLGIKTAPFIFLSHWDRDSKIKVEKFFEESNSDVFIKASNQGSSVGCFHVTDKNQIEEKCKEAFRFSPFVLLETTQRGRELEVAAYEYKDAIYTTAPGEIICPDGFYDFDEKYNEKSRTKTLPHAENLDQETISKIKEIAHKAFRGLKLKDLARIDFFLTNDNQILINEINTFPGHTPISMFPMMMEANGLHYVEFLKDRIKAARD